MELLLVIGMVAGVLAFIGSCLMLYGITNNERVPFLRRGGLAVLFLIDYHGACSLFTVCWFLMLTT